MRIALLPIRSVLIFLFIIGTTRSVEAMPIIRLFEKSVQPLNGTFPPNATYFKMNTAVFDEVNTTVIREFIVPEFPIGAGRSASIRCTVIDVVSPTFLAVEGNLSGDRPFQIDKHIIIRGEIEGIAGSFVSISFFGTYALGFVEIPEPDGITRRIIIAPIDASLPHPSMIVYDERELPTSVRPVCHSEEQPNYASRLRDVFSRYSEEIHNNSKSATTLNAQTLVAQIAVDCNTDFYAAHGNNLSRSANYALAVMGAVSAVYERDMNIVLQVPYLRIWTGQSPYPAKDYLGEVTNYWRTNMGYVQRSLAILMTSYGGGVAWIGGLCNGNGYCFAGPSTGDNFPSNGYVWAVDVVAHELGHNFGSGHTHDCNWNPPIDSCVASSCYVQSYPRIGTILSYCHLTQYGTELRFHPRVATLIRSNAQNNLGSCVRTLDPSYSIDAASVFISVPAVGGQIEPNQQFSPEAIIRNTGATPLENIRVTFTINPLNDTTPIYTNSYVVTDVIAAGNTQTVNFNTTAIGQTGTYQATITVSAIGDNNVMNNRYSRPFEVTTPAVESLQLTYPNGNETFRVADEVIIRWTHSNVGQVMVQFSPDDGITWQLISTFQSAADDNIRWIVPAVSTAKGRVRIFSVTNSTVTDMSDGVFTISLDNDAQSLQFMNPASDTTISLPFIPKVKYRNNGITNLSTASVNLRMTWRANGVEVYNQTKSISLSAGESQIIDFPTIDQLPAGELLIQTRITSKGDRNPANDSLGRSFTVKDGINPPLALRASGMAGVVLLWWEKSSSQNITGYTLYRGTKPTELSPLAVSLPITMEAYTDDAVQNGVVYYYAVASERGNAKSVQSNITSAHPQIVSGYEFLNQPHPLVPENGITKVQNSVQFLWKHSTNAEWYQVQISGGNSMNNPVANLIVGSTNTAMATLNFGAQYSWRVRAFNHGLTSDWSEINTFVMGQSCAGNMLSIPLGTDNMNVPNFEWKNGGAITIEYWNYFTSSDLAQNKRTVLYSSQDIPGNRLGVFTPHSDGILYWDYGNLDVNGRITIDYHPFLDKWTHIAVVSNGTNFKAIYINGNLMASGTIADAATNIKGLQITPSGTNGGGKVDEVRIWKTVRTQEQIRSSMYRHLIPSQEPMLTNYWDFDETTGSTCKDAGLAHTDGTLTRAALRSVSEVAINCLAAAKLYAPRLISPAYNTTVSFSNLNLVWDSVATAQAYQVEISRTSGFIENETQRFNADTTRMHITSLAPQTEYYWRVRTISGNEITSWSSFGKFTTDKGCVNPVVMFNGGNSVLNQYFSFVGKAVTIEFWQKVDTSDLSEGSAFSIGQTDNIVNRFQAHLPWVDKMVYWDFGNTTTSGRMYTDYSPYLNKWTHVALTSDGESYKAIYFNGQQVAVSPITSVPDKLDYLWIGRLPQGSGTKARMSEFRIWNRTRTADELKANMYRRIESTPNLIGYWRMDEGNGSSVADASGRANNGVFFNELWGADALPFVQPSLTIHGVREVNQASMQSYYVPFKANTKYVWVVSGGEIIGGQGTNTVTVKWGMGIGGTVSVTTVENCAVETSIVVKLNPLVAVNEEMYESLVPCLMIRPNPAQENITLTYSIVEQETVRLEVTNTLGQIVITLPTQDRIIGIYTEKVSVEHLSSGLYFVKMYSNFGIVTMMPFMVVR